MAALPLLLALAVPNLDSPRPPPGAGWQAQGVRAGVATHSRPSASGHLVFHGSTYAAGVHVSELLRAAADDVRATEWVDKLREARSARWPGAPARAPWGTRACDDLSFQVFGAPWPVSDREMLMRRTLFLTPANRTARIVFEPAAGEAAAAFSVGKGRVRADAHSEFEFVASERELGTRISLVGLVDPKGSLPAALVNVLNRDWAANTISGLLAHTRRGAGAGGGPLARGACAGVDVGAWGSREPRGAGAVGGGQSWAEWLGSYLPSLSARSEL